MPRIVSCQRNIRDLEDSAITVDVFRPSVTTEFSKHLLCEGNGAGHLPLELVLNLLIRDAGRHRLSCDFIVFLIAFPKRHFIGKAIIGDSHLITALEWDALVHDLIFPILFVHEVEL